MSERAPTQAAPQEFDPLAEAQMSANVGKQTYDVMMNEGLGDMPVADRAQGHQDMADYLTRGEKPVYQDEFLDQDYNTAGPDTYDAMSFSDLAEGIVSESQYDLEIQRRAQEGNVSDEDVLVQPDVTKVIDMKDSLARKFANSGLSSDGILAALSNLGGGEGKKAGLNEDIQLEIGSMAEDIREQAAAEAETPAVDSVETPEPGGSPIVPADVEPIGDDDVQAGNSVFDFEPEEPEEPVSDAPDGEAFDFIDADSNDVTPGEDDTPSTDLVPIETPQPAGDAPLRRRRGIRQRMKDRYNGAAVAASGLEREKGENSKRNKAIGGLLLLAAGGYAAHRAGMYDRVGDAVSGILDRGDSAADIADVADTTSGASEHTLPVETPYGAYDLTEALSAIEIPTFDVTPENNSISSIMMDGFGLDAEQSKWVYENIPKEEWLKLGNTYDMGQNGWVGLSEQGAGAFSFGDLTGRVVDLAAEAKANG
ncbi:MAG: hypothetical protein ACI9T8_000408 [Candidatus Saccharimonadales bacterium]|jgi:hypothetical protein